MLNRNVVPGTTMVYYLAHSQCDSKHNFETAETEQCPFIASKRSDTSLSVFSLPHYSVCFWKSDWSQSSQRPIGGSMACKNRNRIVSCEVPCSLPMVKYISYFVAHHFQWYWIVFVIWALLHQLTWQSEKSFFMCLHHHSRHRTDVEVLQKW